MKREKLRNILSKYYGQDMVDSVMIGRRKPNIDAICEASEVLSIPVCAWKDIRTFLNTENNTVSDNK